VTFEALSPRGSGREYRRTPAARRGVLPRTAASGVSTRPIPATITDPHDERESLLTWAGGAYDADEFSPRRYSSTTR
jgi:hypothetical protein